VSDKKPVVLIADDEEVLWKPYKQFFTDNGFEPIFVTDGYQAVQKARDSEIDLIIMDLNMPHVDGELGIEVLRAVCIDVPIFVVSGFITPEKMTDGIPGADKLFMKPVEFNALLEAAHEILGIDS